MKSTILAITALGLACSSLSGSAAATGGASGSATSGGQGASGSAAFGVPSQSGNPPGSVNGDVNAGVNGNNNNNGTAQDGTQIQTPRLIMTNGSAFPNRLERTNVLISGTNHVGESNTVAGGTNQINNTNQVFVTNQVFSTNVVSATNAVGPNDVAVTPADRVLIIDVRQRIRKKDPGISGSWDTAQLAAQNGTVLVSGWVLGLADKQALLAAVQTTPGVVAVVDQLMINPGQAQGSATTGTVSRYLNPASDPSLGDSYRFSAATNRLGQRMFIPPARGSLIATNPSPTGPTNVGSTNVILEETTGTNLTTVPSGTNTTNP